MNLEMLYIENVDTFLASTLNIVRNWKYAITNLEKKIKNLHVDYDSFDKEKHYLVDKAR